MKVERRDSSSRADTTLEDGDKIVVTDMKVVTKRVKREAVDFNTIEREDASMYEGEDETVRAGADGVRDVTYRLTFRNGELVTTQGGAPGRHARAGRRDRPGRHQGGRPPTSRRPAATTVWDQLAQCESGGNWAINTGNGYYGGLQFTLRHLAGATAAPGCPTSRAARHRSRSPSKVRAATGGYGSWPACSQSLGLPQ